jgi:hypothetical protein
MRVDADEEILPAELQTVTRVVKERFGIFVEALRESGEASLCGLMSLAVWA